MPAIKLPRPRFPYSAPPVPTGLQPPPRGTPRSGSDYDTDWARRPPARQVRAAFRAAVADTAVELLAAPRRRGLDRLAAWRDDPGNARRDHAGNGSGDGTTPLIFAANHQSHLDTPILLTSIPEPWRSKLFVGAAADYFFRNALTSALAALLIGAIPIERARVGRRSADQAAALLDAGWSMLIFPEGGRSPDGWGQPFRGGAAYLALRCGIPVVPVHLEGTRHILRKGKAMPKPASVTVNFGAPMNPTDGEDARRFAARIERSVAELADETSTDWWSARRRAHAGATPTLTGPDASSWRRVWSLDETSGRRRREQRRWPRL
jgi:1-acyl-sn-glycerol-3-phosphate acyltransferase